MYSVTIFKNQYDNKTHRRLDFESWSQFEKFLYKLSQRPLGGKKDAELISPAVYQDGSTRANKNVLAWAGWAAVDVDDHEFSGKLEDELITTYGKYNFICYSTASSKTSFPKFRLVFPLSDKVRSESIKHFWYALNSELGSIGDTQTKDLSRMYYVPAAYNNAFNFVFTNSGGCDINPSDLMSKWEYNSKKDSKSFMDRLPEEWQQQIIEYRKDKLDNNSYTWTGYKDCPFWPKSLATKYVTISSTGWYSQMYSIMIAVAGKAVQRGYPITATEIVSLCREFDIHNGNWYENRPMEVEANNALEYAYKNGVIG